MKQLIENTLEYCLDQLVGNLASDLLGLRGAAKTSPKFDAYVETVNGDEYDIVLCNGVGSALDKAVSAISSETTTAELEMLFQELKCFGSVVEYLRVYALMFVVLHECGHVMNGHFRFLLQNTKSGERKHHFSEMHANRTSLGAFSLANPCLQVNFSKLIEMEADEFAFSVMMGAALEIVGSTGSSDNEHCIDHRRSAEGLMFYACCVALCTIDGLRKADLQYPLPFTRILNLVNVRISYLLNGYQGEVKLDTTKRKLIFDEGFLLCFNALEIAADVCRGFDLELSNHLFPDNRDDFTETILTDDLMLLSTNRIGPLRSREAGELRYLRSLRMEFNAVMKSYRTKASAS